MAAVREDALRLVQCGLLIAEIHDGMNALMALDTSGSANDFLKRPDAGEKIVSARHCLAATYESCRKLEKLILDAR